MTSKTQSESRLTWLGASLELLPWIGLAVVVGFFFPDGVKEVLPYPSFLLPSFVLLIGGAVLVVRRSTGRFLDVVIQNEKSSTESRFRSDATPTLSRELRGPHLNGDNSPSKDAEVDSLTGLATRRALLEQLTRLLDSTNQADGRLALLSITIDEYRDVTESFGYEAGQQLLAAIATRIDHHIPTTATAARIAEDTFSILLTEDGGNQGRELADELRTQFSNSVEVEGHQVPLKASVGLAAQTDQESAFSSAESMLQASYSAMHQATRNGTGEIKVYTPEDGRSSPWLERRERLRKAIQNDELELHYQPIVHLVTNEIVGAEALVRWRHPDRGLLHPAAFLPLAEESGLMGELDRWVLERALRKAQEWTQTPDGPVDWVSVNVSPKSADSNFESWCRDQLGNARLPDGALHLEITERWALDNERALHPLRDEGVRLTIDDFGTGYSSLRYLRSLDADVLKIDREFIKEVGRDEKTTAIVQFLLNLSLRLDVSVIAEGVETAEQEKILRDLGCAMAQGYHFSRPVPAQALVERITTSEDDRMRTVKPAAKAA